VPEERLIDVPAERGVAGVVEEEVGQDDHAEAPT
jgi:hypothetical protein